MPTIIGNKVLVSNGTVVSYSSGIPYAEDGSICVSQVSDITSYNAGIPYGSDGKVAVGAGPVAYYAPGAIPINAAGRVAVSEDGVFSNYSGGFPYSEDGEILVVLVPGTILGGFDSGFDQGYA